MQNMPKRNMPKNINGRRIFEVEGETKKKGTLWNEAKYQKFLFLSAIDILNLLNFVRNEKYAE